MTNLKRRPPPGVVFHLAIFQKTSCELSKNVIESIQNLILIKEHYA